MKHTFQWILVAVCLFVVGTAQVMADGGEEVKTVPIPLTTGKPLNGDDIRGNVKGHSCISPWQYNHVIQRS